MVPALSSFDPASAPLDKSVPSTCQPASRFKDAAELGRWASPLTARYWRNSASDLDGVATFTTLGVRSSASVFAADASLTNNQVAGVSEADFLQTDGTFLYIQSGSSLVVAVVFPPQNARIMETLPIEGTLSGLLIDASHLVVITTEGAWRGPVGLMVDADWTIAPYWSASSVIVRVYDRTMSPLVLQREVELNGSFLGARAIGDHVFVVTNSVLYRQNETILLPTLRVDDVNRTVQPSDIGYIESSKNASSLLGLLNLNLSSREPPALTLLLANSQGTLYVSPTDLYLASTSWLQSGGTYDEGTLVQKLPLRRNATECVASMRVPGHINDEYSLDEFNGNLRVATTVGRAAGGAVGVWGVRFSGSAQSPSSTNGVYVLSENMTPLGRLEGLAPNETIRSARFMGDRLYLVTFKKVDPFFVIDLADPARPAVLGYLKIPGFSEYLHPILPGLVLGIGRQTVESAGGSFAWFQGVKLSLFDVSDVANPREVAKLVIGDRGTSTLAMDDPHAFTWVPRLSMLVLPVRLFEVHGTGAPAASTWGTETWQGAYFVGVSVKDGFKVLQRVSHYDPSANPPCSTYVYPWTSLITRSFESGGYIYTVSSDFVQAHSAATGEKVMSLDLTPASQSSAFCPPPPPPPPPPGTVFPHD